MFSRLQLEQIAFANEAIRSSFSEFFHIGYSEEPIEAEQADQILPVFWNFEDKKTADEFQASLDIRGRLVFIVDTTKTGKWIFEVCDSASDLWQYFYLTTRETLC